MDTHNILHSFCYLHYNQVFHIGIHDIDALDLQEKPFFPPFSLESKFVHQMGQTWILEIISILFVIRHYKQVLFIGVHSFNALVLQEKLLF